MSYRIEFTYGFVASPQEASVSWRETFHPYETAGRVPLYWITPLSPPGMSQPVYALEEVRAVRCVVENGTMKVVGLSACSPLDAFVREKGRCVALTDALKDLGRAERAVIWKLYHDRDLGKQVRS